MPQHDYDLANQTRTQFRTDLNNALAAILSRNSGSSAPATTAPYMVWVDITTGTVKRRNAADSGWIIDGTLDEAFVLARSSNTMLDVSDVGKAVIATSTFTQSFDAAATLGDGWAVDYRNDGTGVVTLDPNGSELINGATTLALGPGESCRVVCNGTAFKTIGLTRALVKVGQFTRDIATTGSQAVTGVGFMPRAVLALASVDGAAGLASWGLSDGTNNYDIYDRANIAAGTYASDSKLVNIVQGGAQFATAVVASLDADGFTVTWSKTGSPTGTATVNYLALR